MRHPAANRIRALPLLAVATLLTAGPLRAQGPESDNRKNLRVTRYTMDVRITEDFTAGLTLTVRATLALVAEANVGPSLRFGLAKKLTVDSGRWGTGEPAHVSKTGNSELMTVDAPHALQAGDTATLTLFYHGGGIDRFANMFFIDPADDWYPANHEGPRTAAFDVTFHSPARYPLISIGALTDSSRAGNVLTTHWVTERPTPFATFNLGLFERYHAEDPGAYPVDVLFSEEAHQAVRQLAAEEGFFLLEQTQKPQHVADDVTNALKFFTYLFGPSPFSHFYVTEIPYPEGVAFPGLIDFSFETFQRTALDGFDEYFRAHEIAHQWWGNGVLPASHREWWLAEGFASFSGIWYVQAERKRSDEYFHFLDQYRSDIRDVGRDAGAIIDATKATTEPGGHRVMIYEKGAWVLNMLRVLMLDLRTMSDDRFIATLKDFYQTYNGTDASTENFQRVVEEHVGAPMDWFFAEWVRGTAIPTYHVAWTSEAQPDGRFRVRLRVRQEGVDSTFQMPVLVSADLGGGRTARFRVNVRGGQAEYQSPLLPAQAQSVTFSDLHATLAEVRTERW